MKKFHFILAFGDLRMAVFLDVYFWRLMVKQEGLFNKRYFGGKIEIIMLSGSRA